MARGWLTSSPVSTSPLRPDVHVVDESAIWPHLANGTTVRVRVLADNGRTAEVQVEDCGVWARQGQIHHVPSSAVRLR